MEIRDYEVVLNSMHTIGVYVIREDDHRILYFNQRVKDVYPDMRPGLVCHEIWPGVCSNCPLIYIGGKKEYKTVNYNNPFGKIVDIVATRITWEESVSAFLITVMPHVEAVSNAYNKILKVYLTEDTYEVVKMNPEDRKYTDLQNSSLSKNIRDFIDSGYIYAGDVERLKKFIDLQSIQEEMKNDRHVLICTYRRLIHGSYRWYTTEIVPVADYSEQNQVVMLYERDVHDVYGKGLDLEKMSIQNDRRMAVIIKSRFDVMNTIDLDTGMCERIYLGVEDEGSRIRTGDYDYYIEKAVKEVICEEDIDKFKSALSLDSLRKKAEKVEDRCEEVCRYRVKHSQTEWVEERIFFIRQNGTVLVNILGRDITKEKQKEAADKKAKTERANIIYSLSSLFFATYYMNLKAGTFRMIKQMDAVGEVLGAETNYDEAIRRYAGHFVHPDDREEYLGKMDYSNLMDTLDEEHPLLAVEYRRIKENEDGSFSEYGWVRATIVLADSEEGKPTTALYTALDVTDSKQKEEKEHQALKEACEAATRANASKSEFLSRMSHDIRTPMNAIIGMTAIAGTHLNEKERVADCLNKITVSSKHLLSLINEVLDMSKIESGKIDLEEEEFQLPALIQNLMTIIRPSVLEKNHDLRIHIGGVEHEDVIGDVMRLQQVFVNILGNAVKYTPPGGKLEVEIAEKPSRLLGYGCYEFVFRDNGIGMSDEYQKKIFEPFSRAEDSRISKIEGTGLGMAIAMNIIRMMNGAITLESELGKGSQFTVTVFLKQGNTAAPDVERFVNLPVLVADDDRESGETACRILDELGMKSQWVLSGMEAVKCVRAAHEMEEDFFAVILDWQMPDMDGIATAKEIRKQVGPDVPIIILSAYDWSRIEEEAREAGVDGFISKPLFRSKLVYLFKQLTGGEENEGLEKAERPLSRNFTGSRVLLVEDNELNREIAEEVIGGTGAMIESVENGRLAVERFEDVEDGYYDLIFMDIQMPVMNGYEAARAIRGSAKKDGKRIPIIAMTANAFVDDVMDSKRAGMNEHIAKPLDFDRLIECMNRWLQTEDGKGAELL